MIVLFGFFSCSKKLYVKEDYTFYDKNFSLPKDSSLKTDGIYVLESIWTNENGGTQREPKNDEHMFYKFYDTGQANLTLDMENQVQTKEDYVEKINKEFEKKQTLFEGYYKLKDNKICIQRKVVPRRQFNYSYGYVEKDKLIIVSRTHEGSGKFEEKHFTDYYKETYRFLPLNGIENRKPYW